MTRYLILLRGINVGGKNKVPMAELRAALERAGFTDVATYIASGNVIASSELSAVQVGEAVEELLPRAFALDSDLVRVHVLTRAQLARVIDERPPGFGDSPDTYHSDAIFLIGIEPTEALEAFSPRDGVDAVWTGPGVIYSQRLSADRTKSRLNKIMSSPLYRSMTIRNWRTTTKLMAMLDDR